MRRSSHQTYGDLQIVYRNCEHLSSMIDDVLDLSQVEAGGVVLHRGQVDLTEVIDSAVAIVRPLIEKKRLALHVAIQDDLPEVDCDRTRIRQVVLNLISNAARFTERGRITVWAEEREQYVTVGVSDTGPGIPPKLLPRIFDRFWRSQEGAKRRSEGMGLGLAIAKRILELHGGPIEVESKLGVGTSFSFKLPTRAGIFGPRDESFQVS